MKSNRWVSKWTASVVLLSLAGCGTGRTMDAQVEDAVTVETSVTDGTVTGDGPVVSDGTTPLDATGADALPDGVTRLPDGSVVMMLPDGAVVPFDGGVPPEDGATNPDAGEASVGPDVVDPREGGPTDDGVRTDAADVVTIDERPFDGSMSGPDAMGLDEGVVTLPDGAVVDAPSGTRDGAMSGSDGSSTGTDVVTDMRVPEPPVYDECMLGPGAVRCTSDSMCNAARNERCLSANCGADVHTCQPSGRACANDGDCLSGLQRCASGRCVATGTDCGDTRACPLGYLCEGAVGARRCVDRRRSCTLDMRFPCPINSTCLHDGSMSPICVPVVTRCQTNTPCVADATCQDVNGDGLKECVVAGLCSATDRCPAGRTCQVLPVEVVLNCGLSGVCSGDTQCSAGFRCVDAWGTGVRECRSSSLPCQTHDQCPAPRRLCDGNPPTGAELIPPGCH